MKLSKRQKEGVERWLTVKTMWRKTTCPFGLPKEKDSEICRAWFPKILKADKEDIGRICGATHSCPCESYNSTDVYKKAKEKIHDSL